MCTILTLQRWHWYDEVHHKRYMLSVISCWIGSNSFVMILGGFLLWSLEVKILIILNVEIDFVVDSFIFNNHSPEEKWSLLKKKKNVFNEVF